MTELDDTSASYEPPRTGRGTAIALIAAGTAVLVLWLAIGRPGSNLDDRPLPVISRVPDFSLIERSGATVTRADLLGKVWVVDFVFTSCAGPCPEMTLRMRSLQETLRQTNRDVTLVTVTCDPARDTPGILARYADKYHADPKQWLFLTGSSEQAIHDLIMKGFLQALAPATKDSPIIHSTRFVLVDKMGRIRKAHEGLDVTVRDQLLHDLDKLLSEDAE